MNILFDLLFVIFMGLGFAFGWWRGFISFFAKPLKYVGGVILSSLFATRFSDEVLSEKVSPVVQTKINAVFQNNDSASFVAKVCKRLSANVSVSAASDESFDLPQYLTQVLTGKISYALSVVLLFMIGFVGIAIIVHLVRISAKKGPVSVVDHTLGLGLGGFLVFLLFLGVVRVMNTDVLNIDVVINTENSVFYPILQKFQPLEFIQNIIRKIQK